MNIETSKDVSPFPIPRVIGQRGQYRALLVRKHYFLSIEIEEQKTMIDYLGIETKFWDKKPFADHEEKLHILGGIMALDCDLVGAANTRNIFKYDLETDEEEV